MLTAPSLGYLLLSPMIIVFAAAVIGVLVEAFMGKTHRAAVQLTISIGALSLALLQLWRIRDLSSTTAAVASVTIDKAGIFLQATVGLSIDCSFVNCRSRKFHGSSLSRAGIK